MVIGSTGNLNQFFVESMKILVETSSVHTFIMHCNNLK